MHSFNSGIPEERPLLVVRIYELNRRVVTRQSIVACVHKKSIIRWHYGEVLVAFEDTHHILHGVCVRLSQSTVSMPVCHLLKLEEGIHDGRVNDIVLHWSRRILERVVVVVGPILFLEFVQEFTKGHVDSASSLREVSKTIVMLAFCVDYLLA